jgi:uncharacterized protein YaiI (UPF0178 family)
MGLTRVANKPLAAPESECITALRAGQSFDVVNAAIAERVAPGDLVVAPDIPLAAQAIANRFNQLATRLGREWAAGSPGYCMGMTNSLAKRRKVSRRQSSRSALSAA